MIYLVLVEDSEAGSVANDAAEFGWNAETGSSAAWTVKKLSIAHSRYTAQTGNSLNCTVLPRATMSCSLSRC